MKKTLLGLLVLLPFLSLSAMEIVYNCGPDDGEKSVLMLKTSPDGSFFEYRATYIKFAGFPLQTIQLEGSQETDDDGEKYYHMNDANNINFQVLVEKKEVGETAILKEVTLKDFTIVNDVDVKCFVVKIKK